MYTHPQMDLTLTAIERRLDQNKLAYGELELQNGVKILLLERGGRVLGPFLTPKDNTLLWASPALADALKPWHGLAAYALAGLAVLHVAAALKHQLIDRDGLMARMLPGRG